MLLCKTEVIKRVHIIKVMAIRHPSQSDYVSRSRGHVTLCKEYILDILRELAERLDVDTIIDVHTHPFAQANVHFSGIDDGDEAEFSRFLSERFDDVRYGSLVLSRSDYSARMWERQGKYLSAVTATIKTQTKPENWPAAFLNRKSRKARTDHRIFDRITEYIDAEILRGFIEDQRVLIIGVGGLGSLLAENLVHMGFHELFLVDPDFVEFSNLSRLVGATYNDAKQGRAKVDVVKDHLININPKVRVHALRVPVEDKRIETIAAAVDWIVVATDNHGSRFHAQSLAMRFFTPLLSVGVNITVKERTIADLSGEVITVRVGDCVCLNCLGRLNPIKIASEQHPDELIRTELVEKGYVQGVNVKEPAVKTLNAVVAALACDQLINEFTQRQEHPHILVYESNSVPRIYIDTESVRNRNLRCFSCNVVEAPEPLTEMRMGDEDCRDDTS
jgi:molybdopterin/thiamine biosynthesis adenylyltransferase